MHILLIEPFCTGSHQQWAEGWRAHSRHRIELLTLPGRHWKWRMHGGAITLAQRFLQQNSEPDLIIATDMLDLTTFLALTRQRTAHLPTVVYFHENQLTYPWSPTDQDTKSFRDQHYAFINVASATAADEVWFNSQYHHDAFTQVLPKFLNQYPDHRNAETASIISAKSQVLPIGLALHRFDDMGSSPVTNRVPIVLWNHRWEYDKNPDLFFKTLFRLADEEVDFQLVVLGTRYRRSPIIFDKARDRLRERILQFGPVEQAADYAKWLHRADLLPVTSRQDFFGISAVEAMYCGTLPLLPNRLAFPEHLPQAVHSKLFYDSELEFYEKLKIQLEQHHQMWKTRAIVQKSVEKYDWKRLVKRYDDRCVALSR